MAYSEYSREEQEMLKGLRGKDRAKMIYAIEQARMELRHSEALFDDHARKVMPLIQEHVTAHNEQIAEGFEEVKRRISILYDSLEPILAPYKPRRTVEHNYRWAELTGNIIDQARWANQIRESEAIRKALFTFRSSLTVVKPPTSVLSDEEKVEIVKAVTTVIALPANAASLIVRNAKGEIEV